MTAVLMLAEVGMNVERPAPIARYYGSIIPARIAYRTRPIEPFAPSFFRMFVRCISTVLALIPSVRLISLELSSSASSFNISVSRGVNAVFSVISALDYSGSPRRCSQRQARIASAEPRHPFLNSLRSLRVLT